MSRVASMLVENEKGEVLLVQRNYGKRKYKWSIPGGFVEKWERSKQGAARELYEETGIKAKSIFLLTKHAKIRYKVFYGKIIGGKINKKSHEVRDVKFFKYNKLPKLAFNIDKIAIKVRLRKKT